MTAFNVSSTLIHHSVRARAVKLEQIALLCDLSHSAVLRLPVPLKRRPGGRAARGARTREPRCSMSRWAAQPLDQVIDGRAKTRPGLEPDSAARGDITKFAGQIALSGHAGLVYEQRNQDPSGRKRKPYLPPNGIVGIAQPKPAFRVSDS